VISADTWYGIALLILNAQTCLELIFLALSCVVSNLKGPNLDEAKISYAKLDGANFANARLFGADLPGKVCEMS